MRQILPSIRAIAGDAYVFQLCASDDRAPVVWNAEIHSSEFMASPWFRQPCDVDTFGLVGSIWQRRPSDAPPAATKVIRSKHKGPRLVYFLSQRPITTSSHYDVHFDAVGSSLRSTTRLGPWTDLVSSVHCSAATESGYRLHHSLHGSAELL